MKNAGDLLDDPIGWLKAACDECKPGQLNVSVSVDASETGAPYPYRNIVAVLKDGELRTTSDLRYDEVPEMDSGLIEALQKDGKLQYDEASELESGLFDGCEELENFQPCFAPDSFCDILVAKNCSTFEVGEVGLVFKTEDGEETTEPIRINPNECENVYEALECKDFYLEQGCDTSLLDADGNRVCKLADIDIAKVLENEQKWNLDESAEFLGLSLPGLKKPIMLKAWKKSKQ